MTRSQGSSTGLWMATLLWLVALVGGIALAGFWVVLLTTTEDPRSVATDLSVITLAAIMVLYASLGWIIVRRRPGHRVGWLLLATPPIAVMVFGGFGGGPALASSRGYDDLLAGCVAWLAIVGLVPFCLVVFMLLPLLFPDGRLPGPRWRLPVAATLGGALLVVLCYGVAPGQPDPGLATNPFGIPWLPDEILGLGNALSAMVIVAGSALGVASIAVRFRRGRGEERQQVKWMLAAIALVVALNVPGLVGVESDVLAIAGGAALGLIPAAITLAILRYRLYEIDRLVSRTISYALVMVSLVATFAIANLALQAILADVIQSDTIAIAGSTLLAFAVAQPIWRRIRRFVDLRFDRARIDAERTIAAFAQRQRSQVDRQALVDDVRATVSTSLHPATIGIWLRDDRS